MAQIKQIMRKKIVWLGILAMLVILPTFAWAGHRQSIYVNAGYSGTENGSASHPYKTIEEALKKADEKTDIHVAKGTYKENIEIPDGVALYGENKEKTIIKGDSDDPVVIMHNKSKINKFTVKNGDVGIQVDNKAKASISSVIVKDNDHDGIRVEEGPISNERSVSISESEIKNNGRAGIFSKVRRLVIMNNDISDNEKDGLVLAKGVSAWIEDNDIKNNDGSGMVAVLDRANIWTKNNNFSNNKREGVEVSAYGEAGRLDLNKGSIKNNNRFGVAKIVRGSEIGQTFSGLTIQSNVNISNNNLGSVSHLIWIK